MNKNISQIGVFLSEMSAHPVHGGGITLQRVIADQLLDINWFIKTLHFPSERMLNGLNKDRDLVFQWWNHERWLRPFIGCTRACRLSNLPLIRRAFAKHVAREVGRLCPGIFEHQVLICPQADISLLVADELMKRRPLNYVTWMMDDHLVRWQDGEWKYPLWIEKCFRSHLQNASQVFVISREMREFYRQRYGVDSVVLHAPAPVVFPEITPPLRDDGPVRLVYFGSLGPWQNDALEMLQSALSRAECELDIFTHSPDLLPEKLRGTGVRFQPPVAASEVQILSAKYDAVVLPLSFRDDMRQMSYFNIATKFSECLGGPVPTLLIGPADSAMMHAARDAGAAFLVDQNDTAVLSAALTSLKDKEAVSEVVAAAHRYVRREMSVEVMRTRWQTGKMA